MPQDKIDVVSEFIYDSANPNYNRSYRSWRQNTASRFVYRFVGDPKERVYTEGGSDVKRTPISAEFTILSRVSEIIGLSLLVFLLCETLGGTIMVWFLQSFGINVRLDFLTFSHSGSQWAVMLVRAFAAVLKFAASCLVAQRFFRIPRRVGLPAHIGDIPELILAIGLAMGAAAIFCTADAIAGDGRQIAETIFTYKDSTAIVAYAFVDVTLFSLMTELYYRGIMLPVLRQFGDRFAVLAIAGIGFLQPNQLPARIGEFFLALGAGYLMLKGGSFLKCVLMRAIYTAICYSRLILVYSDQISMSFGRFLVILLLSALIGCGFYLIVRTKTKGLSNLGSYLSIDKKTMAFVESVTMLPWICCALLVMMLQVLY